MVCCWFWFISSGSQPILTCFNSRQGLCPCTHYLHSLCPSQRMSVDGDPYRVRSPERERWCVWRGALFQESNHTGSRPRELIIRERKPRRGERRGGDRGSPEGQEGPQGRALMPIVSINATKDPPRTEKRGATEAGKGSETGARVGHV